MPADNQQNQSSQQRLRILDPEPIGGGKKSEKEAQPRSQFEEVQKAWDQWELEKAKRRMESRWARNKLKTGDEEPGWMQRGFGILITIGWIAFVVFYPIVVTGWNPGLWWQKIALGGNVVAMAVVGAVVFASMIMAAHAYISRNSIFDYWVGRFSTGTHIGAMVLIIAYYILASLDVKDPWPQVLEWRIYAFSFAAIGFGFAYAWWSSPEQRLLRQKHIEQYNRYKEAAGREKKPSVKKEGGGVLGTALTIALAGIMVGVIVYAFLRVIK